MDARIRQTPGIIKKYVVFETNNLCQYIESMEDVSPKRTFITINEAMLPILKIKPRVSTNWYVLYQFSLLKVCVPIAYFYAKEVNDNNMFITLW